MKFMPAGRPHLASIAFAGLGVLSSATGAATIDFEDLGIAPGSQLDPPDNSTVTSGGFDFVNGPSSGIADLHVANANSNTQGRASTEILSHGHLVMTQNGGGTFSLTSFEFGNSNVGDEAVQLTVQGNLSGGGSVVQTFTLDGATVTLEQFDLNTTFVNLDSAEWIQAIGSNAFILDNIVVNGVPAQDAEPTVEAVEKVASETTSIVVSNIATNVTDRVRTAFRALGRVFGNGASWSRQSPEASGLAAGEQPALQGVGAWASPSYTRLHSDLGSGHSGYSASLGAGVDKLVRENAVVGVSAAFEQSDAELDGALSGDSSESSGGSLVVYGGFQLDEFTLVDGFAGVSLLDNEVTQGANKASYDSRRFMVGGTLSRQLNFTDKADITASGTLVHSREAFDDYTLGATLVNPDDVRLTTAGVEVEIGGRYGEAWPYVVIGGEKQLANSAASKDRNLLVGGGVVFQPDDRLTAELSVMVRRGRFNDSETLNASLRWTF